ncbi:hypothetical protein [Thermoflexus sp.]|jgi:hypothetical protein|uniref:hypothetical protein n=1 Tax=Thermoflexus sp. TaxID=1969742 RepID=UPI002ADD9DB6|nr:hypothetical protein [Thermoflexus sp.]
MGRRGRPRKEGEPVVIHIRLRLWPGEDDDLIRLLAEPRKRARLVRMALRGADLSRLAASHEGPSEEEILDAFSRLIF